MAVISSYLDEAVKVWRVLIFDSAVHLRALVDAALGGRHKLRFGFILVFAVHQRLVVVTSASVVTLIHKALDLNFLILVLFLEVFV